MSRCQGSIPVSTKVDKPMREFIEDEAQRLGMSRSELLRRLLEVYQDSQGGRMVCENCNEIEVIRLA